MAEIEGVRATFYDGKGQAHDYYMRPFAVSTALPLAFALSEIASPLLGGAVGVVIDAVRKNAGDLARGDASRLVEAVLGAQLDSGTVSAAVERFARHLAVADFKLVERLLSQVSRDSKPLAAPGAIDQAFTLNLGELAEVLMWVVKENRLPDFFTSFVGGKRSLDA